MQEGSLKEYLIKVEEKLRELEPLITSSRLQKEWRSSNRLVLRGVIAFIDGSTLYFLEYIMERKRKLKRISYRFHYTGHEKELIFRYDNAPHHPEVPTHPHHKHLPGNKVISSREKSLVEVLDEIKTIITSSINWLSWR